MVTEAWTLAGCGGAASKPAAAAQEVPALLHPAAKKPTSLRAVAVASNVSQDGRRDASAAVVGRRRGIASCLLATPALAGASSGSAARAAILEADDDLELLERVKEDKKRLRKQGIINSSAPETGPGVQAELVLAGRGQGDSSTREAVCV